MDFRQVKSGAERAVAALKNEVPPLEFGEVHERTTAHRLACHLQTVFQGWNVDCEYDRHSTLVKEPLGVSERSEQKKTDRILPDIVVHHRRERGHENNLLVIELKKDSGADICDKQKLELLTAEEGAYHYQLGLYINIDNCSFECTWYKEGRQI